MGTGRGNGAWTGHPDRRRPRSGDRRRGQRTAIPAHRGFAVVSFAVSPPAFEDNESRTDMSDTSA